MAQSLLQPGSEELPADEIHVWRASLDQPATVVAALGSLLSGPERARVGRIPAERIRRRLVVARGLVRMLLGRYAERRPQDLEFTYGEHGKPFLAQAGPWFNLSHSGWVALIAFSSSVEVGVDVELADRRVRAAADRRALLLGGRGGCPALAARAAARTARS